MASKKSNETKSQTSTDSNIKDASKTKTLDELKNSINKRFEDIEHNFYQIGLDLIKVNLYVKNFRKWVKDNTTMGVSTAYMLMQLVKRDQELSGNEKYQDVKPSISMYKLIKLLKYPADFIDKLDFAKVYDVPGGLKFNLLDMPRELFAEVIEHEFRMLTAKERGDDTDFDGVPMDEMIISKAKDKLNKLSTELEDISTVLHEINLSKDESVKDTLVAAIEKLEAIHVQASRINEVTSKLLSALKGEFTNTQAA
jgi:hypothetical protein